MKLPGSFTVIFQTVIYSFLEIQTTTWKDHRKKPELVPTKLTGVGGIVQRNLSIIGLLITNLELLRIAKTLKKGSSINRNNENAREQAPIDIGHLFDQKRARLNNAAITHSFKIHIPKLNKTGQFKNFILLFIAFPCAKISLYDKL